MFERITNNKQSLNYEQTTNKQTHPTKMSVCLAKFNQTLSALAKPFKPGSQWMKAPKVSWHRLGITDVRYFDVSEGALARKAGENSTLKGPPASPIKNADRDAAMPFKILDRECARARAEEKIHQLMCKTRSSSPWRKCITGPLSELEMMMIEDNNLICITTPLPYTLARTQPNRFNYCDN